MCKSESGVKVHPATGHLLNVRGALREAAHHNPRLKLFGMISASKNALIAIGMTADDVQRWDDRDDQYHADNCNLCKPKDAVLANAA